MTKHAAVSPDQKPTIMRLRKVANFLVVANALFSDERLSWEACCLMGYLLTKPDNWRVRGHDLVAHGPAGVHKIRRMLRRTTTPTTPMLAAHPDGVIGTFDWETVVYEVPSSQPPALTASEIPACAFEILVRRFAVFGAGTFEISAGRPKKNGWCLENSP